MMDALVADPNRAVQAVRINRHDDVARVDALVDAMHNMDTTEDNPGMLETWRKMKITKAEKIERVCSELLVSL